MRDSGFKPYVFVKRFFVCSWMNCEVNVYELDKYYLLEKFKIQCYWQLIDRINLQINKRVVGYFAVGFLKTEIIVIEQVRQFLSVLLASIKRYKNKMFYDFKRVN